MTTAQGPKKNNTMGYPVMKKKKRKKRRMNKVQRIGIQRPMKGKGFKNTQKKGKAQSAKVSKPKRSQGK